MGHAGCKTLQSLGLLLFHKKSICPYLLCMMRLGQSICLFPALFFWSFKSMGSHHIVKEKPGNLFLKWQVLSALLKWCNWFPWFLNDVFWGIIISVKLMYYTTLWQQVEYLICVLARTYSICALKLKLFGST